MPLSEKALRAYLKAWGLLEHQVTEQTKKCLSAFQAALLEELREKVERNTCDRAGYLRRDYVLALLSPPPPEPRFRPGDWIVVKGAENSVYLIRGGKSGTGFLATLVTPTETYDCERGPPETRARDAAAVGIVSVRQSRSAGARSAPAHNPDFSVRRPSCLTR